MTIHHSAIRLHIPTMTYSLVRFGEVDTMSLDGTTWHKCDTDPDHCGLDLQSALLVVNRWNYLSTITYSTVTYIYYLPTADGAM